MKIYLLPVISALVAITFAGTALAWNELTESTSDSTTTTTDVTTDSANHATVAQQTYLQHNYFNVARDAAVGGGEHLGAFGGLLGCNAAVRPRLFRRVKLNHGRIFIHGADADETLATAKRVLGEDELLAKSCRHVASLATPLVP